jgi:hypothetical protein
MHRPPASTAGQEVWVTSLNLARDQIELQIEHLPAAPAIRRHHLTIVDPTDPVGRYDPSHAVGRRPVVRELNGGAFVAGIFGRKPWESTEPLTQVVFAGLSGRAGQAGWPLATSGCGQRRHREKQHRCGHPEEVTPGPHRRWAAGAPYKGRLTTVQGAPLRVSRYCGGLVGGTHTYFGEDRPTRKPTTPPAPAPRRPTLNAPHPGECCSGQSSHTVTAPRIAPVRAPTTPPVPSPMPPPRQC